MKWIGEHIVDLIARFRGDVYLEDVSSGTIASGGNLGLDSNNKIVKAADSAPDADASTKGIVELATTAETTTGTDATRAVTPDGLKDGYQGSTNVTTLGTIATGEWRGTALGGSYISATQPNIDSIGTDGDTLSILGDRILMENDTASRPGIDLNNTADDSSGSILSLNNLRRDGGVAQAGEIGDNMGSIYFGAFDDQPVYAPNVTISSMIINPVSGAERARLTMGVMANGTVSSGLTIQGAASSGVVDASIGLGTASTTTVAGDLVVTGDITGTPTKRLHYIHADVKDAGADMTDEYYVSLGDADRESTSELNVAIPIVMPATGVLKRVIKRSQSDLSAKAWSYKIKKIPSGTALGSNTLLATVTKSAGGAANTNSIIDFVTDSGDATNDLDNPNPAFSAGDAVLFSYQCTDGSGPSGTPKIMWVFVFEVDDTTAY